MNATVGNADKAREYTVFVSHASADRDIAAEFVDAIESKGLTAWIAPRDISPGREYAEEIIKGIDQSKCFVLLVSGASNLSAHVRREVERAASKSKPIYPVRIEDVPPSPKLEYFISMHQSLDALDGVLATHAERIAAAIASDEEWVDNRVLTRRRRWRIGAGLSSILLAAVVFISVVFAPDMRTFFMNHQDRAVNELAKRGSALGSADVARAMGSANVAELDLFLEAGIGSGALTDGFVQAGRTFFERSQGNPEAVRWLKDAIAAGVDPNLTVESEHYVREGLISSAFGSGNVAAILALLESGASPHPYIYPPTPFRGFYFLIPMLSDKISGPTPSKLRSRVAWQLRAPPWSLRKKMHSASSTITLINTSNRWKPLRGLTWLRQFVPRVVPRDSVNPYAKGRRQKPAKTGVQWPKACRSISWLGTVTTIGWLALPFITS